MKAQAARTASPLRYCGRSFTPEDLETIRAITEDPRHATRKDIARAVCAALHWVQPDGQPKLVSCHVALQGMEAHGVIWLPLPTRAPTRPRPPRRTPAGEPGTPITGSRGDLREDRPRREVAPHAGALAGRAGAGPATRPAQGRRYRDCATRRRARAAPSRRQPVAPARPRASRTRA